MDTFIVVAVIVLLSIIAIILLKYFFAIIIVCFFDFIRASKYKKRKSESFNAEIVQTNKNSKKMKFIYYGLYKWLQYKISFFPSNTIRLFFYKHIFHMRIGRKVSIHFGLEIRDGFKIQIGDGSIIGDHVLLDGRKEIIIGRNVNISSHASIYTLQHDPNDKFFNARGGKVTLEDYSWISSNTVVLPGVNAHKGCVLAACAVATKDLEKFGIFAGIPAKMIGTRENELLYNFDGSKDWFL